MKRIRLLLILLLPFVMATPAMATPWYVSQDGAGNKDGTTYNDRWDGLLNVVWGGGGVVAGDTLYICGLNIHDMTGFGGGIATVASMAMSTGTVGNRIIIRGDYPGDAGIVWGVYGMSYEAWTNVSGNVWHITLGGASRNGYFFEDMNSDPPGTLLDNEANAAATFTGTWTFTNGSDTITADSDGAAVAEVGVGDKILDSPTSTGSGIVASITNNDTIVFVDNFGGDTGEDGTDASLLIDLSAGIANVEANPGSFWARGAVANGDEMYVQCSDSGDPTGRVYANRYGYRFNFFGLEYITFLNIELHGFYRIMWEDPWIAEHIRWEGCSLTYGEHSIITPWDGSDYTEVIDCDFSIAKNAIYTISNTISDGPSYYTFSGNNIHDIGILTINQNSDAHGIGIQGGHDGLIENNTITNCGSGPLLHASDLQELKNVIVRYNWVEDTHELGGATGYGASTQCGNEATADKSGIEFYGNIVIGCTTGLRFQFEQEQLVYNNVMYRNSTGLGSGRNSGAGVGANIKARNNIFIDNTTYHWSFYSGALEDKFIVDSDYNSFWPVDGDRWRKGATGYTFAEWQALNFNNCTFDDNSLDSDPTLVGPERGKFAPMAGSIVIDAGVESITDTDYRGNPIDTVIGAINYTIYGLF